MTIDGRSVRRALSKRLRPELEQRGFNRFDVRSSWRRNALTVDLIVFQFVSAYNAVVEGCTSLSFSCQVGVYYPSADETPVEWPQDYNLTFRAWLGKSIDQPLFRPSAVGRDRSEIWYVFADGSNMDLVVEDAARAVLQQAVPFINRLDDPAQAIEELRVGPGTRASFGQLGVIAGGLGSPFRLQTMARLAPLAT